MATTTSVLLIFTLSILIILGLAVMLLMIYGINSPQQVSSSLVRLRQESTLYQTCLGLPCAAGLVCDERTNTCKLSNGSECYNYNQCLSHSQCQNGVCRAS